MVGTWQRYFLTSISLAGETRYQEDGRQQWYALRHILSTHLRYEPSQLDTVTIAIVWEWLLRCQHANGASSSPWPALYGSRFFVLSRFFYGWCLRWDFLFSGIAKSALFVSRGKTATMQDVGNLSVGFIQADFSFTDAFTFWLNSRSVRKRGKNTFVQSYNG